MRTFRTFCGKPLQGNPHPSCPGAPTAGAPGPGVGSKGRSRGTEGHEGQRGDGLPCRVPRDWTYPARNPDQPFAAPPRASGHGALSFGGPAGPVFNVHTEGRAERSVSWPRCGFLLKMGQEGNVHHTQQPTNSGPSRPASHHSPGIRPEGSLRCLPASLSSSNLSTHPGDAWGLRRSVTRLAVSCRVGEINQTVPTLHRTNRRRAAAGYVELIKVTLPCIEYLQGS